MSTRRSFMATLIATTCITASRRAHPAAQEIDSDQAIRELLRTRIDVEKHAVGMIVAVVRPERTRFIAWGKQRLGDARPVAADTLFEIGSITKVFTCLLMSDMAQRGLLKFGDPVSRHLPEGFPVPQREGEPITLADLAAHFSGLPRGQIPPFGEISAAGFKAWLGNVKLEPHADSAGWWYSNAGYTLLGMALAHRGGQPYETLLRSCVTDPLHLSDTTFEPTPAMRARLAESHDASLAPLPPFDAGIYAAAGGLRSTARDLARFAAAMLQGSKSRFASLNRDLLSLQRPAILAPWAPASISARQALGWEVRKVAGGDFISKDGVTTGQTATFILDTTQPLAVIVLSNTFPDLHTSGLSGGGIGAADLAQHLVRPEIPLNGQGGAMY